MTTDFRTFATDLEALVDQVDSATAALNQSAAALAAAQQQATADHLALSNLQTQLDGALAQDASDKAKLASVQAAFDQYVKDHTTTAPPPALRFPGDPGLGNMYVGESVGGGDPSARESKWGAKVGVYRSYFQWNQNQQVVDRANRDLAAGRLPFISVKDSGSWANMASGAQDSILKDLMSKLGAVKGPVWLAFHHEPYDDTATEGPAADFAAMNKHLMGMLPSNVALVPILQTSPFDPTVGGNQSIAPWYPPGSYTFIGLDTYNHRYYVPAPGGGKYRDPATVLSVVTKVRNDLGLPNLPIVIAEFGTRTNPAVPGQAAQWLRDFVTQAKAMNIPAVCYFDSGLNVKDGGTPWSLDDKTDGTDGTERLNAYGPLVAAGAHL